MNTILKNILISLASLILLTILALWLNRNCFFLCLTSNEFNNLLGPIISLISVILLILTLTESQKFNRNQLALNEYEIVLEDYKTLKEKFQTLRFKIPLEGHRTKGTFNEINSSNGINYIGLMHNIVNFELAKEDEDQHYLTKHDYNRNFIFPLVRSYKELLFFVRQLTENEFLTDRLKRKFYGKLEQEMLQHYLRICNNLDRNNQKDYDLSVFATHGFNHAEFYELNDFLIENKLLQINNLRYYQKTL